MGKHRTPNDLLADALKRVQELKVKVIQDNVRSHPKMASLLKREKEIKSELAKSAKWLDPEKGLVARIARLTDQIGEAQHKLDNATELRKEMTAQLKAVDADKKALASELSADEVLESGVQ